MGLKPCQDREFPWLKRPAKLAWGAGPFNMLRCAYIESTCTKLLIGSGALVSLRSLSRRIVLEIWTGLLPNRLPFVVKGAIIFSFG